MHPSAERLVNRKTRSVCLLDFGDKYDLPYLFASTDK